MKILLCLSVLAVSSSYATYVAYPYVYRTPVVQNGFYPSGVGFSSLGAPSLTVIKPYYPGFYDYRLGLSPTTFYQPSLYPGGGIFASPTIIHLVPAESGSEKKPKKKDKKGKDGKEGKDKEETTTMEPEDEKEDVEKAEARDGDSATDKSDSIEVETV